MNLSANVSPSKGKILENYITLITKYDLSKILIVFWKYLGDGTMKTLYILAVNFNVHIVFINKTQFAKTDSKINLIIQYKKN